MKCGSKENGNQPSYKTISHLRKPPPPPHPPPQLWPNFCTPFFSKTLEIGVLIHYLYFLSSPSFLKSLHSAFHFHQFTKLFLSRSLTSSYCPVQCSSPYHCWQHGHSWSLWLSSHGLEIKSPLIGLFHLSSCASLSALLVPQQWRAQGPFPTPVQSTISPQLSSWT